MNRDLSIGLERVRVRFLGELIERTRLIDKAYSRMNSEGLAGNAIEEICAVAHKIAGTAGTLGFEQLGMQAAKTEDMIRKRSDGQAVEDATLRAEIIKLIYLANHPC